MRGESKGKAGRKELKIRFTEKRVSGWGGLVALVRFFEQVGLREKLREVLPDGRRSPNQIDVVDIALGLLATVLTGGSRFAHAERVRSDEVVRGIVGAKRLPSAMTVTRYFGGFRRSQVEVLGEQLWAWMLERWRSSTLGTVLDLDSTVLVRYGSQEGSAKGHNPRKRGRPSHHPLLAFFAEAKIIVHLWLRSGNTASARGACAFLSEVLARLPRDFRLYALRADSGFCTREFLLDLEKRELPYAIAARLTRPMQRVLASTGNWRTVEPGLDVTEVLYQPAGWREERRFIVVRQEERLRPTAGGRRLFDVPGYVFHALVTNLPLSAVDAWRFYNGRSESENRFKELKEDYGIDGFCLHSFYGTEAVLRLICCLYNLVQEFKRDVLRDPSMRLMTLRSRLLVVGAVFGTEGRNRVLRLALRGRWRERFEILLDRLHTLSLSTVTQFQFPTNPSRPTPSPWRPRTSPHCLIPFPAG